MQAAIIAGGTATRLGALTRNLPKSLVSINGRPFIEYQLEFLKAGGVTDIVLCLGYLGKQIEAFCGDGRRFGVRLKYSFENERRDTAGALRLAEPFLHDTFFTLYGDSYVLLNFRDMSAFAKTQGKLAVMSVFKNINRYDKSNTAIANRKVTRYSKEDNNGLLYIDYGVNYFRKDIMNLIPESQPYSLGALFHDLITRGELSAYEVKERFYEIGSLNGINECTEYLRGLR
jgi:N-acetyl-alpha-D-muramate 1-phosphate uridylyltransferase